MKAEVYKIFNDIQTRTNTTENLDNFVALYEKSKGKAFTDFRDALEQVFLIVMKNYEKNNVVLKNIKEFVKLFIEKIIKITKLKENTKILLNFFCKMFTGNVKKPRFKTLCIYFLNIFLIPYSNNFASLYESETLEDIKIFILNILRGKQTSLHMSVLKLLQKHTILQREGDVWERLENLLNNSTQVIKKEILKLLEIDNQSILNYLLEMYDDDSVEIRNFVYEKLSEMKNFEMIDSTTKVKLFYVGLGDNSAKVQTSAKKFLKHYLYSLGVYKGKKQVEDDDRMLIDNEDISNECNNVEKSLNKKFVKKLNLDIPEESDSDKEEHQGTAHDKIVRNSSPMKLHKKKLTDSPSRVFDKLDIRSFYNHPKYSYTFCLITEAIMEFTDNADLVNFLRNIIDNMILVSNSQSEMKFLSSEKKKKNSLMDFSGSTDGKVDKYALFNDIYFLQNCLRHFSGKQDEASMNLKNSIFELLPDNKTFAKILNHFYTKDKNIMILHQLFLIAMNFTYSDEIGNREMISILKKFISDLQLDTMTMTDYSFKKLNFGNNFHSQPEEIAEYNNEEITPESLMQKNLENILLPPTRKMILSMEDLIEYALKILLRIHYNQQQQLFTSIMESVNEISEPLEVDKENLNNMSMLKSQQKDIVEQIKTKLAVIGNLESGLKNQGKSRIEVEKKIKKERLEIEDLDDQLFNLTKEEKNILSRKLVLCDFLIKYCKVPVNMFENMVNSIILPTLSRKDLPEVFKLSYNAMGLLAINFFNSNYKNFLRLFYDQIEKSNPDFTDFEMLSLMIIFDSILQHNVADANVITGGSIEDKIDLIIKKYLYHADPVPRVIAFTGLCKLLIANRIGRPEFVLARLICVLYKSFETTERTQEDFHVKIFEMMQSFLYAYCLNHRGHVKNMVKAVLIILTTQTMGDSLGAYEKTVTRDFQDIKFEFLSNFLLVVNDFGSSQNSLRKIVFKIFKFLFFAYKYTSGDFDKALDNNEVEVIFAKKIDIKYKNKQNIKNYIKKLFEKCHYDRFLLEEMAEDTNYIKLFPFMLCLDDHHALKTFSENLGAHFDLLKEKNFIYEYCGNKIDLSVEDKQNELRNYVDNKQIKYYKLIEENYAFVATLKNTKLNVIEEENSRLLDEDEEVNEINQSKNDVKEINELKEAKEKDRKSNNNKSTNKKNNLNNSTTSANNINPSGEKKKNSRNSRNTSRVEIEDEEEKVVDDDDYIEKSEPKSKKINKNKTKTKIEEEEKEKSSPEKKGIKRRSSTSPGDKKKANKKNKK